MGWRSAHLKHRRLLLGGCLIVVLSSATTLALASRRIASEDAAYTAPAAGRCVPATLNASAVLPGTSLAVSPLPGSYDASPSTQISLLGVSPKSLGRISVTGTRSGSHPGRLRSYSQGDGASFIPSRGFTSGETVTVRGSLAGRRFAFQFAVAHEDQLPQPPSYHRNADPNEKQHFHSRPDLEPPVLAVTTRTGQASPGYLFASPYNGPGPAGPMIFDEAGNLVWFDPLANGTAASDLQVQQLGSKPVLTWWQGYILPQGFGEGEVIIADSSYHQIGRVHAGNGYKADLHDFHLTPQGTAIVTAFDPIYCDLSSLGGPRGGAVTDSLFQEIDLRTGLVRREWHGVDHVALSDSYSTAVTTSKDWPFDFFHINSIDQSGGQTLLSARNTWAMYQLDTSTGQVLTRIGGRHSDISLAAGARTAFQHDAEMLGSGDISIFDNGAVPKVHPQSRGLVLSLDPNTRTATVVAQYEHPSALSSGSQGNVQTLPNGNIFVGWGAVPYFSEFSAGGQLLFDAHMHGSYQSYRGYRSPWTGSPGGLPSIAARSSSSSSPVTVYASWNGDTRTATWQVIAGASRKALAPVASAPRTGFETAITTPGPERYVAVQALDSAGSVIGTSHAMSP